MENDKLFELMSKMYKEMNEGFKEVREDISGIKQDASDLKQDVTGLKQDVAGLKQDVKVLYVKVDEDLTKNIKALHDGYKQNYEDIAEIKKAVQSNTEAIDEINLNLSYIKEDVNFIAGKSIRNDIKIDKLSERLKAVK